MILDLNLQDSHKQYICFSEGNTDIIEYSFSYMKLKDNNSISFNSKFL